MKKSYVKPQVCFESFQLSASIAAPCAPGFRIGPTQGTCTYDASGMVLFLTSMDACNAVGATPIEDGSMSNVGVPCYHVPYGENLFASA